MIELNKEPILELHHIAKNMDLRPVLKDMDLTIFPGRIIGLIGDNGLGKTTLLRVLSKSLSPDSGTIDYHRTRISYVPELNEFSRWMRVKDALFFYRTYYNNFDMAKARQLLIENNISIRDKIHKLSLGQQERLFLILSVSQDADLYLMDEPFSGIDPYFKKDIRSFLLRNIPENATIIMATHLLRELEQLFDEIIFLTPSGIEHLMADEIREHEHQSIEDYYLEVITHGKK